MTTGFLQSSLEQIYYYSTFGRKIVQSHKNIKHIHVIFDEIYSSKSINEDIFLSTKPGSKIYIKVLIVYLEFFNKPLLEYLDLTKLFESECTLWIWITSLSWSGFNNSSRNVFTITPEFLYGTFMNEGEPSSARKRIVITTCITCKLQEGYEAEKILERVGLS